MSPCSKGRSAFSGLLVAMSGAVALIVVGAFGLRDIAASGPPSTGAKDTVKTKSSDIYDLRADGEKQIADALAVAKRDHVRVLLQFGANWCKWCHKLHDLFEADKSIAKMLQYEYVVVPIDVDRIDGKQHNQATLERYGQPTKQGLPVLVVLDEDGKPLVTQETGSLEEGDHHDPAKVLAFLKKWQASPPEADALMAEGLKRARAESKAVFVDFSAPWCGWCRRLDAYLHRPEISRVFDAAFVTVKIDVDRFRGGKEMNARFGGGNEGLPFFVILDATGSKQADSKATPGGNIGFPAAPEEIAHFMKVVRQAAPRMSDKDAKMLEDGLKPPAPADNK